MTPPDHGSQETLCHNPETGLSGNPADKNHCPPAKEPLPTSYGQKAWHRHMVTEHKVSFPAFQRLQAKAFALYCAHTETYVHMSVQDLPLPLSPVRWKVKCKMLK
jgi:hypothetical protein